MDLFRHTLAGSKDFAHPKMLLQTALCLDGQKAPHQCFAHGKHYRFCRTE